MPHNRVHVRQMSVALYCPFNLYAQIPSGRFSSPKSKRSRLQLGCVRGVVSCLNDNKSGLWRPEVFPGWENVLLCIAIYQIVR